MLSRSMTSDRDPVRIAVKATSEVCSLPAYPIPDWCERCATALSQAIEDREIAVTVSRLGDSGLTTTSELSGATDPSLVCRETASGSLNGGDDIGQLGWAIRAHAESERTFRVSTIPHYAAWAASSRGTAWKRLGSTDILIGVHPVGDSKSRALVVEIGLDRATDHDASVLARVLEGTMPVIVDRLILALGTDAIDPSALLTTREQQVLERLVTGATVRAIATELNRSPHTVHDHVKSLHRKFNASTRGELVARALGHVVTKPAPPYALPKLQHAVN